MLLLISTVGKVFAGIGIVVAAVLLFVGSYVLNKRTKKPDGCESLDCEGCSITNCSHNPNKNKDEEKGEEK